MSFILVGIKLEIAIGVRLLILTFTKHVRNRTVSTDVLRNGNDNTAQHTKAKHV
jgi:hypothetical protein